MKPLASCVALLASCASAAPARVDGPSASGPGDYAERVDTPAVWQALAATPGSEHLARTEVVKVIVDHAFGDQVYFVQTRRWPIHYDFARKFLSRGWHLVPEQGVFNRVEYHEPDRRFVLGTIAHYLDADVWAFELVAGDELPLAETARIFALLAGRVFFGAKLRYRPVPAAHEEGARLLMPVVTTDELYGALTYQPLELGVAFGYLRIFPKGAPVDPAALRRTDLVVLGDTPEDIPVVAGVITDDLQAPLGHINVLCHNRRTANMALRGASNKAELRALEGQLVRLRVSGQAYELGPARQADAEAAWEKQRPSQALVPARDDRDRGLPLLAKIGASDVAAFGAKTTNLAAVSDLEGVETPRAFGLPMHAYLRFVAANGLDRQIEARLIDPRFENEPAYRRTALAELQGAFMAGRVPDEVMNPLLARIAAVLPAGKVRLRSSTNAEDLPGFNGAGLYRSTRVDPRDRADVARGLKEVWASVWGWAAFEERRFYRIDPRRVGMAILVQGSIDDDVANGVAITANPFDQGRPAFLINAQITGGTVTGARGDQVPEQVLYYTFTDSRGFERLSKSSLAGGKTVLRDGDVEALAIALGRIHRAFTGQDGDGTSGEAVDVEFLVVGSRRRLVIVQARPYHMTWLDDRRWLDEHGAPIR